MLGKTVALLELEDSLACEVSDYRFESDMLPPSSLKWKNYAIGEAHSFENCLIQKWVWSVRLRLLPPSLNMGY